MALRLVPEGPPGMLIVRLVGQPNSAASAFGRTTEVLYTSWPQEQVSQ
jgi:hypothetical protein